MTFVDSEIQSIEQQLRSLQFGFSDKVWTILQEAASLSIQKNFDPTDADQADEDDEPTEIQHQEKLNEFAAKYKIKGSWKHAVTDQFSKKEITSEVLSYMAEVCIKAIKKDYDQHPDEPLFSLVFKAHRQTERFAQRLNIIVNDVKSELETVVKDYYSMVANRDLDGLLDRTWEISPFSGLVNGIGSLLSVSMDLLSGLLCCLNPFDETPYAERIIKTGKDLFSVALSLLKMKLTCIISVTGLGVFAESLSNVIIDFLSALLVSMVILCYEGSVHSIKKPNQKEINDLYLRLEMLKYMQHSQWQIDAVQRIDKYNMEHEPSVNQTLSRFEPKEWVMQRQEALQKIEDKYKQLISKSTSTWEWIKFWEKSKDNWQSIITEYVIPVLECVQADEKPISFVVDLVEKHNKDIEAMLQEGKRLKDATTEVAKYIRGIEVFLEESRSKVEGYIASLQAHDEKREQGQKMMLDQYHQLLAQFENKTKALNNIRAEITAHIEKQNQLIEILQSSSLQIKNVSEQHSTLLTKHNLQIEQFVQSIEAMQRGLTTIEKSTNDLLMQTVLQDKKLDNIQAEIDSTKREIETKANAIETKKELEYLATQLHAQRKRTLRLFCVLFLLIAGSFLLLWLLTK